MTRPVEDIILIEELSLLIKNAHIDMFSTL